MKVLAVCGLGIGSSMILKINISKMLDELGVEDYSVDVADIGTAKSIPFDLAITSIELADVLRKGTKPERHFRIIPVVNFVNKQEMREKVSAFLEQLEEHTSNY